MSQRVQSRRVPGTPVKSLKLGFPRGVSRVRDTTEPLGLGFPLGDLVEDRLAEQDLGIFDTSAIRAQLAFVPNAAQPAYVFSARVVGDDDTSAKRAARSLIRAEEQYPQYPPLIRLPSEGPPPADPVFVPLSRPRQRRRTPAKMAKRRKFESPVRTLVVDSNGVVNADFDANFPEYRRLSILGQGSYGKVYLAQSRNNREEVAIKEARIKHDDTRDDFESEVEVMTRLQAHGAPVLKGSRIIGGYGIIVMEKLRPIYEYNANILRGALRSLWELHNAGVFHNDAYTRNILLRNNDVVFVDFGMSILFMEPVPLPLRYVDLVSICFGHMYTTSDGLRRWGAGMTQQGKISMSDTYQTLRNFLIEKGQYYEDLLEWAFRSRVSDMWDPVIGPVIREPASARSIYRYIDSLRIERAVVTSPTSEKRLQDPGSPIRAWGTISDDKGILPP